MLCYAMKALELSSEALLVPLFFLLIGAFFFGAAVYYFENLAAWADDANASTTDGTAAFPSVGDGVWFMIGASRDSTPRLRTGRSLVLCRRSSSRA